MKGNEPDGEAGSPHAIKQASKMVFIPCNKEFIQMQTHWAIFHALKYSREDDTA